MGTTKLSKVQRAVAASHTMERPSLITGLDQMLQLRLKVNKVQERVRGYGIYQRLGGSHVDLVRSLTYLSVQPGSSLDLLEYVSS